MGKTGWQVAAFAMGLAFIGAGFGALANRSALQQERANTAECTATTTEAPRTAQVASEPKRYGRMDWPDNVRCQGGVLLIHTEHGFESLLKNGRAMPCEENPWR